ncbi:MAG: hypothetical protein H5T74_09725 [Actinobacteria bacterium]|nr:hypothetical protein [Actinomycetota bacterium]
MSVVRLAGGYALDIYSFNPWWRTGGVDAALAGRRRRILKDVLSFLDLRQMQILF